MCACMHGWLQDAPTPEVAAAVISSIDFIIISDIVALILAQSAADRKYMSLVMHLLKNTHGAEIYFRNPLLYNINPVGCA